MQSIQRLHGSWIWWSDALWQVAWIVGRWQSGDCVVMIPVPHAIVSGYDDPGMAGHFVSKREAEIPVRWNVEPWCSRMLTTESQGSLRRPVWPPWCLHGLNWIFHRSIKCARLALTKGTDRSLRSLDSSYEQCYGHVRLFTELVLIAMVRSLQLRSKASCRL